MNPTTLRVRRWIFVRPQSLPREGLTYEIAEKNSVTFRVAGAKAATVQKVRMDEGDWNRFLEVLETLQEP